MTIKAFGKVRAWADGIEMLCELKRQKGDTARVYQFTTNQDQPCLASVLIAIRVEQERGCYKGAVFPEPIIFHCGHEAGSQGVSSQRDRG